MTELVQARRDEILDLCRRCRATRLDLFGSAATGLYDPASSDFDFVVDLEPEEPVERAEAFFRLLEGLEQLLGRHVDLVVDRAIRNPTFREAVDETRQAVYAA
ncbi:MAG: nucleotidyltransferase domain-containing protein [Armatimonadetes bacterium]|nr:nucleotidyltransferase domain-containing protein [Armatimonadota bacterium]